MAKGTLSVTGYNWMKQTEGYKTHSYKLSGESTWTVGLGIHGSDIRADSDYTDSELKSLFASRATKTNSQVNAVYDTNKGMTQNMFDALFLLSWNYGHLPQTVSAAVAANPTDFKHIYAVWTALTTTSYTSELKKRRKEEAQRYCGTSYSGDTLDGGDDSQPEIEVDPAKSISYDDTNNTDWDDQSLYNVYDMEESESDNVFSSSDDNSSAKSLTVKSVEYNTTKGTSHSITADATIRPTIQIDEHSVPVCDVPSNVSKGTKSTTGSSGFSTLNDSDDKETAYAV